MSDKRDYRDYKKRKLSASTDGNGIQISATASPGTFIHQALSSVAVNEWDEITLRAVNLSSTAAKLTVEWGSTAPEDQVEITIPPESGFVDVIPGHVLQNSKSVRAFASVANVLVVHGFVNRYENT